MVLWRPSIAEGLDLVEGGQLRPLKTVCLASMLLATTNTPRQFPCYECEESAFESWSQHASRPESIP
jgi:hypothetical protein